MFGVMLGFCKQTVTQRADRGGHLHRHLHTSCCCRAAGAMATACLPQDAGQLLGRTAPSRALQLVASDQAVALLFGGCAVCGHHRIQLWDRAESLKALQPGWRCNPVLLQLLSRLSRGDYPQRILCTGVGTGGGLAALAALWAVVTYPAAQVRLITFGAPPVSPSVQRQERVARFCSKPGRQACCPRAWHVWQGCTALHGRADQLQQQPALPCAACSVCHKAVVPPASSAPANRRRPSAPFCSIHRTAPTLALLTCQTLHLHHWL